MSTITVSRPRGDGRDRVGWRLPSGWLAFICAAVLAIAIGLVALDEPERYDIEVSNPTAYEISVGVSDGSGGGELALMTLEPGTTRSASDVMDQGGSWVFTFRAHGRDGGELLLGRDELAGVGWQVAVPDEVVRRLQLAGAQPEPS
jgi:hypothetical protein